MKKISVSVIGGDRRFLYATRHFIRKGFDASFFSDNASDPGEDLSGVPILPLKECLKGADAVLLPLPASRGGGVIDCPLARSPVRVGELFCLIPKGTHVFAGMPERSVTVAAKEADVRLTDYYTSESLLTKNALYTAEGALSLLISEQPRAVCSSLVVVFGYGRIASLLTRRLISLGARVNVVARSESRRALALSDGAVPFPPDKTADALRDVICAVNTVPAPVLTADLLTVLSPAPYMELASSPGASADEAARAGVRFISASSLPGRFSPESAGVAIADRVISLLG